MRRLIFVLLICAVILTWETLRVSFGDAGSGQTIAPLTATAVAPNQPVQPSNWPVPPTQRPEDALLPVTISIPSLHVQAPVYERGMDEQGLLAIAPGYAVTHFQDSAPIGTVGNYVVYGHDDIQGEVFKSLAQLRPGDSITLSQGAHRYTYLVAHSRVVAPTAVEVLQSSAAPIMTLISCTPYGVDTQRIVVTAGLSRVS